MFVIRGIERGNTFIMETEERGQRKKEAGIDKGVQVLVLCKRNLLCFLPNFLVWAAQVQIHRTPEIAIVIQNLC
jgi:hypothetical protein